MLNRVRENWEKEEREGGERNSEETRVSCEIAKCCSEKVCK